MTRSRKPKQAVQKERLARNVKTVKGNKKDLKGVKTGNAPKKKGFLSLLFGGKDVPKTVQDTIPYKHIYKDGICALPDGKYNKTITFQDINYQLAQTEDQQRIFDSYCKFLNYFDPSVEVQLSFVNKFGNKMDIEASIDIPDRDDNFNSIREEYRDMLKNQLAKGNNGLVKHKYITFTIEAKSLKEAKTRLERMEADMINNFKMMGVRSWSLNGKERVQLLHSQLHPDGREKVMFDWNGLAKTGMSTKDIISPSSFDFKGTRDFKMGATHGSVRYVQIIATELPDDLLNQFLNMESALTVTIHMKTIEHSKALKIVKRKITDIDSMKITEQKNASKNGYDWEIMPSDLMTYGEDAKNLLRELQSRNERMFLVTVLVMNMANTKSKLNNEILTASGIAQKENCALKPLDFQQEQGLVSSLAIGKNEIEIERTLTTSSTAIFVPFTTSELFEDGQTMYYGLNALSNNLIMCNRKNLINPKGLYCKGRFLTSKYYIKAERAKAVHIQLSAQPHAQNNRHHHRERHRGREDIFSLSAFKKLHRAKPKSQAEKLPTAKSKTAISKKEHFILAYDVFQHSEKIFSLFQKRVPIYPIYFPISRGRNILESNHRTTTKLQPQKIKGGQDYFTTAKPEYQQ